MLQTIFKKVLNKQVQIPEYKTSDIPMEGLSQKIQDVIQLIQLTSYDLELLHKIDDIMEEHAPIIAERHYNMIMKLPEIKEIFNTFTSYDRYVPAITNYYKQLTKPIVNRDYIQYRKKVGMIHSRIQLTDEWYIGSYIRVYEYLLPFIATKFHRSPKILADIMIALNRIITFDAIIVLDSYQEANDFNLVESVSDVMEHVINIDEVGNLLAGVDQTSAEAMNVSSAAQELHASVEEVAVTATTASAKTNDMVQIADEGKQLIEASLTGFLHMTKEFEETKSRFENLTSEIDKISEVIVLIKGIADETNLLALNASIEAARAGEHGLGFAVVATEIRKLAEQTKISVEEVTTTIDEVLTETASVSSGVMEIASDLGERVKQANMSIGAIEKIMEEIKAISEAITNIAITTEEEASATEQITSRIDILNEHFEQTKTQALLTGESVYNTSLKVDEIRKKTISEINHPTQKQILKISKTEHMMDRWWMYNRLIGYSDPSNSINVNSCLLDEWENKNEQDISVEKQTTFKRAKILDNEFHGQLAELDRLIKGNKSDEAARVLIHSKASLQKLLATLDELG